MYDDIYLRRCDKLIGVSYDFKYFVKHYLENKKMLKELMDADTIRIRIDNFNIIDMHGYYTFGKVTRIYGGCKLHEPFIEYLDIWLVLLGIGASYHNPHQGNLKKKFIGYEICDQISEIILQIVLFKL